MAPDIRRLEELLQSQSKSCRLKALKLLLTHDDATPLQLIQCLTSPDNRNFEFLNVYGLQPAMRHGWRRMRGEQGAAIYEHLERLYNSDPDGNASKVASACGELQTQQALSLLNRICAAAPAWNKAVRWERDRLERVLSS